MKTKTLKLTIIFLLVAGAILLIFNLDSITGRKLSDSPNDIETNLVERAAIIEKEWSEKGGWDSELFKRQRESIENKRKEGIYSDHDYETIINKQNETVVRTVSDAYFKALKNLTSLSDKAAAATFDRYSKDMVLLEKDASVPAFIKKHDEIRKINKVDALFKEIKDFSTTVTPDFNFDSQSWTSFSSCRDRILGKAKKYRENKIYRDYLSHIKEFKTRLGISEKELNEQAPAFYKTLSNQIIATFEPLERTEGNQKKLTALAYEYDKEAGQKSPDGSNQLSNFINRFYK